MEVVPVAALSLGESRGYGMRSVPAGHGHLLDYNVAGARLRGGRHTASTQSQ